MIHTRLFFGGHYGVSRPALPQRKGSILVQLGDNHGAQARVVMLPDEARAMIELMLIEIKRSEQ